MIVYAVLGTNGASTCRICSSMYRWCYVHVVNAVPWTFDAVYMLYMRCNVHMVQCIGCTCGVVYIWCSVHDCRCGVVCMWCYVHFVHAVLCACGVVQMVLCT